VTVHCTKYNHRAHEQDIVATLRLKKLVVGGFDPQ